MHNLLDAVRIVLVCTSHPGNIGAAARAMKTMNLARLTLVDPSGFPSADATARASGADDVLAAAEVHSQLDEALAESTFVVGASARLRSIPMPQLDPRSAADRIISEIRTGAHVAVLFGRERSGLTNDELSRCHALVNIPTNPEFPSLNLAAAVQVLCYELRMATNEVTPLEAEPREAELATTAQMEGFFGHLEETLLAIGFLDPKQSTAMMLRLRRMYGRARPSSSEIDILRGILARTLKPKARNLT